MKPAMNTAVKPLVAALCCTALLSGCVSVGAIPVGGVTGGPVIPPTTSAGGADLQAAGDNLFIDAAATPAQNAAIAGHVRAARGTVAGALGSSSARPAIRVCVTTACDGAFGMTTRGLSVMDQRLDISSRAWDHRPTYVHELVHVQMHTPDLMLMRLARPVPVWFDEGIATRISGTVGADLSASECAAEAGRKLPDSAGAFTALTREVGFRTAYGAAACRVRDWIAQGNSTQGAIAKLRSGQGLP